VSAQHPYRSAEEADNTRTVGAIGSLIDELSGSRAPDPFGGNMPSSSMPVTASYFDNALPFLVPERMDEGYGFLTQNDEVSSEQLASFDIWLGQFGSEIESQMVGLDG